MIKLIIRRLLFLILVIWAASTITFFIPRLSTKNPVRERFAELARSGGFAPADMEKIIASYSAKFGLDKSLGAQYLDYMTSIAHFDLGVSYNKYPKTVIRFDHGFVAMDHYASSGDNRFIFCDRQLARSDCRMAAIASMGPFLRHTFYPFSGCPAGIDGGAPFVFHSLQT